MTKAEAAEILDDLTGMMDDDDQNEAIRMGRDALRERLTANENTASGTGRVYDPQTGDAYSKTINPPVMMGWVCPVCGRGLSPYTSVCPCKGGKGWEVTC